MCIGIQKIVFKGLKNAPHVKDTGADTTIGGKIKG
jgi:hypothetical protein